MKKKLFKAFIPHGQSSDEIPRLLQAGGAISVMLLGLGLFILVALHANFLKFAATDQSYAAVIASVMVDQTNDERRDAGLTELKLDPKLVASAQLKADDMAQNSYFAHTSPLGISPWFWFGEAGYKFNFAGENLAVNFRDSAAVTRAWMNSPTHRENIENENFTEIGIATAVGRYKGKTTTFVTQHFGDPYPDSGFADDEILSLINSEPDQINNALTRADQLVAATGNVNWVDRLLVQPSKLYKILYGLLIVVFAGSAINAIFHIKDKQKRLEIIKYSGITALVLMGLFVAMLIQFNTQAIAAGII